jgi:hypothetical protein
MLHTQEQHAPSARVRVRLPDDLCACPGFASTAVYFERLAQKETRDEDRRCRLLEVELLSFPRPNHPRHPQWV